MVIVTPHCTLHIPPHTHTHTQHPIPTCTHPHTHAPNILCNHTRNTHLHISYFSHEHFYAMLDIIPFLLKYDTSKKYMPRFLDFFFHFTKRNRNTLYLLQICRKLYCHFLVKDNTTTRFVSIIIYFIFFCLFDAVVFG